MSKEVQIPYQVQNIIDNLLDKKDNVHIRANYRMRLDTIKSEIEKAIRKYDMEASIASTSTKKRA